MKNATYIILLLLLSILANGQSTSYKLNLNNLDFSRYPKIDLFCTLTDSNNEPVENLILDPSLIEITHNEKNVKITDVNSVYDLKRKGELQLYISLVIDNSSSMEGRMNILEEAAGNFIKGLLPEDWVSIFDFRDYHFLKQKVPESDVSLFAGQRIGFSNSKNILLDKLVTKNWTHRTYMYDALFYALSLTNESDVLGKKIIIFFSDGKNIGSNISQNEVINYSRKYSIPIFSIDLNTIPNKELEQISQLSGGEYFFIKEASDLIPLYSSLLKLLKNQYRITYEGPKYNLDENTYNIVMKYKGTNVTSNSNTFYIDPDRINFYNIAYLESQGKEQVNDYLNFLLNHSNSKFVSDIELKLGNYWFLQGEYDKALSVYNKLLRNNTDPIYYAALSKKTELLLALEGSEGSLKLLDQLSNFKSSELMKPQTLLDIANLYRTEGKYTSALDTYSEIIAKYEGTKWAGEALLEASVLRMSMGDFENAKSNFEVLVQDYGESRAGIYGKYEFARLERKSGNTESALSLYSDIMQTNIDLDLKEECQLRICEIKIDDGDFGSVIPLLKNIYETSDNPLIVTEAKILSIESLINLKEFVSANRIYESLDNEAKHRIIYKRSPIIISDNFFYTVLMNGTYLKSSSTKTVLSVINDKSIYDKYNVSGQPYKVEIDDSGSDSIEMFIPNTSTDKLIGNPGNGGGAYVFENNIFELIASSSSIHDGGYYFPIKQSGNYVVLNERPIVFSLDNIYFDLGKATIRKTSEKNLFGIIDYLKEKPEIEIEIAGHTDSTGTDEINFRLSLARAESVRGFFEKYGIDQERIKIRGYGSQYPVVMNNNEVNRQKNRRTEFIVINNVDVGSDNIEPKEKYISVVSSSNSVKEVSDLKRFFQKKGFELFVISNQGTNGNQYDVILGIHNTKEEAEESSKIFESKFSRYKVEIRKY